ncbi:ABC-F family ATP-binding cassette domain-containing protein, partial [bacterium]|nr:ABC-F family ATP-binding cassette domain-containing protein [bacterium]
IGIVGANGTGKTTLLRLLAGLDEPTRGDVHVLRGTRIGYLEQEPDFRGHGSVLEAALSATARLDRIEAALADIHDKLAHSPADADRLLRRQGDLEHEFERLGGYTREQRAEAILHGLGFHGDDVRGPVEPLSGGERSRLAMAHLLLQGADVLLLDEPTNHLDLAALDWLESFLSDFSGATILVSHDRYFLDGFANRIVEVGHGHIDTYKGNYSAYITQRAERAARQHKLYDLQQERLAKEADFIQRYAAGQRGKEAKGRLKKLQRVEVLDRPADDRRSMHLRIEPVTRGGNDVLNVVDAAKEFDGRVLFSDLSFQVLRGDRIGIVGPNGAGKTTLLRCIVGDDTLSQGTIRLGHNIDLAYYRQDRLDLDGAHTVLDEVWSHAPRSRAGELRSLLGMFLFSEGDVFKKVGDLSGGEQARVALAKLILSAPNLLLLDEPTNHLDIASRLCLEDALNAYQGTVLMVSHDRYVLERVANKILEVKDGQARLYHGSFSAYTARLRDDAEEASASNATANRRKRQAPARQATQKERKPRPVTVLEKLIFEREEAVETLQHAMSDPEIYKSPDTVRSLSTQLKSVRVELAKLYDEWDDAADAEH